MSSTKRTITVELQTPKRQADFSNAVAMPRTCSVRAALAIGEGLTDAIRLTDGRKKYATLRQILLDEQAASMATNRRFRDVSKR